VLLTVILQLATIYVPAFQTLFRTQSLSIEELVVSLVLSSIVFVAVEIEKMLVRSRNSMSRPEAIR
jgi:Ca2+-transporting ATPase